MQVCTGILVVKARSCETTLLAVTCQLLTTCRNKQQDYGDSEGDSEEEEEQSGSKRARKAGILP